MIAIAVIWIIAAAAVGWTLGFGVGRRDPGVDIQVGLITPGGNITYEVDGNNVFTGKVTQIDNVRSLRDGATLTLHAVDMATWNDRYRR